MKCPVCRAPYRPATPQEPTGQASAFQALHCRRCGVDLAPLIHLHDQAIWHYRQAIQFFNAGDYGNAMTYTHQALALHAHQADFHALAGQLRALQGDWMGAIAAWQVAQHLDPQNSTAITGLQLLEGIAPSSSSKAR